MEITKASFRDFQSIKDLMLTGLKEDPNAFSVSYNEYFLNSDDWWHRYIDSYTFGIRDSMYLAFEGTELMGMVGVILENRERKKHVASIVWLFVKSQYRGKGVGRKLLNKAIKSLEEKPEILKISLLVNNTQTKAINLYRTLGFVESGILKKDLQINNEYLDTVIMEKMLSRN